MKTKKCTRCSNQLSLENYVYIQWFDSYSKECKQCTEEIRKIQLESDQNYKKDYIKTHGVTPKVALKLGKKFNKQAQEKATDDVLSSLPRINLKKYNISLLARKLTIAPFTLWPLILVILSSYIGLKLAMYFTLGFSILSLLIFFLLIQQWAVPVESKIFEIRKQIASRLYDQELQRRAETRSFYSSTEWRTLRNYYLNSIPGNFYHCTYCKKELKKGEIQIDHIKPRSKFPELRLALSNLTTSCQRCNARKGARVISSSLI